MSKLKTFKILMGNSNSILFRCQKNKNLFFSELNQRGLIFSTELVFVFAVCKAGFTPSGNAAGTCEACAIGNYKSDTGAGTCKSCGVGKTTAETGSTATTQCGKYRQIQANHWRILGGGAHAVLGKIWQNGMSAGELAHSLG